MVDQRTYARINLSESPEEEYRLTQVILDKLKFKPKEKDDEKFYIHSKTKLSWMKNKFATDFRIIVRPENSNSIIDIYSDVFTLTSGPDPSYIVDPFYHMLCQLISDQPPMDVSIVEIKKEEIKQLKTDKKVLFDEKADILITKKELTDSNKIILLSFNDFDNIEITIASIFYFFVIPTIQNKIEEPH